VRVVVVADTHLRPSSKRGLPAGAVAELARADVILHAGDVVAGEVLDQLAGFAPVHAVLGNNDAGLEDRLPEVVELELGGVAVAMVHDSGPSRGRAARLARRFPDAGVVVFGHSHIPVLEQVEGGRWLCNPGSPTQRRRQPHHTLAVLDLDGGEVRHAELVVVDPPAPAG
jgi:putative phosphoesterase